MHHHAVGTPPETLMVPGYQQSAGPAGPLSTGGPSRHRRSRSPTAHRFAYLENRHRRRLHLYSRPPKTNLNHIVKHLIIGLITQSSCAACMWTKVPVGAPLADQHLRHLIPI